MGEQVRKRQAPVIGEGQGVWNFVHVEDAAAVTAVGVDCAPALPNSAFGSPLSPAGQARLNRLGLPKKTLFSWLGPTRSIMRHASGGHRTIRQSTS